MDEPTSQYNYVRSTRAGELENLREGCVILQHRKAQQGRMEERISWLCEEFAMVEGYRSCSSEEKAIYTTELSAVQFQHTTSAKSVT